MRIEKPMESFGAFRQLLEISIFHRLRKRIEEAPNVPPLKSTMGRLSPLMKHVGNQTVRAHTNVHRADDQVMGTGVVDVRFFLGADAFVLIMPFRQEEPD